MTKTISIANSVRVEKVSFLSNNIKVVGNLYYPESNVNSTNLLPAIVFKMLIRTEMDSMYAKMVLDSRLNTYDRCLHFFISFRYAHLRKNKVILDFFDHFQRKEKRDYRYSEGYLKSRVIYSERHFEAWLLEIKRCIFQIVI